MIRDILRCGIEAAEDRIQERLYPPGLSAGLHIAAIDLRCELAALEHKRAGYDANISRALVPKTTEFQTLQMILDDMKSLHGEAQFLYALKGLTEEGLAAFDRIQPAPNRQN